MRLDSHDRSFALGGIAVEMAKAAIARKQKTLMERATQMAENLDPVGRTFALKEIVAELARLGYLRQAREMAEREGAPAEVDALAAIVLADVEASRPCLR
jgi:hypothetical protein